jgi:transcriptional antiterminator RfaH
MGDRMEPKRARLDASGMRNRFSIPQTGDAEAPRGETAKARSPEARAARWYVVQTIRGREQFAKQNLDRQNVPTYLPLFSRPALRRNAVANQISAFFPGYLFVSLPRASSLWRSVGGTYGVSRIVRFGETQAPVPEGMVEYLKARTGADGVLGFEDQLKPGDRVRVVGGAFDQVYGRLCSIEPAERVVVLLQLLGREVALTLPRRSVMACDA